MILYIDSINKNVNKKKGRNSDFDTCCRTVVIFVCGIRNAMNDVQQGMSHLYKCQDRKRDIRFLFRFTIYDKMVTIVHDVIHMGVKVITIVKKKKNKFDTFYKSIYQKKVRKRRKEIRRMH